MGLREPDVQSYPLDEAPAIVPERRPDGPAPVLLSSAALLLDATGEKLFGNQRRIPDLRVHFTIAHYSPAITVRIQPLRAGAISGNVIT